jgi:hypothetical protein
MEAKMIIDYDVVTAEGPRTEWLTRYVKEKMASGWQPIGGITVISVYRTYSEPTGVSQRMSSPVGIPLLCQAVVKYAED